MLRKNGRRHRGLACWAALRDMRIDRPRIRPRRWARRASEAGERVGSMGALSEEGSLLLVSRLSVEVPLGVGRWPFSWEVCGSHILVCDGSWGLEAAGFIRRDAIALLWPATHVLVFSPSVLQVGCRG